ncbi:MAG: NADP(H)-dependent aldo-keto reductase [Alphaproteobacteria bacterium]|nr:MAG: NADP(H)-dependent aldo-keto reductase [Alphaproteobacteria bacterium]
MEYRRLGRTDIDVSVICLGTMTWGQQNTEAEAHEQLDYALDHEVNFIDTAEMYPVPPMPDTQGRTESYIGSWIADRKNRDKFILATKVAGAGFIQHIRGGKNRLDKKNIFEAVEDSLQRLQTDYIDLYQLHWPDRPTNQFGATGYIHKEDPDTIPIAETLDVLQELIKLGKVRHVGVSNETPWGMLDFVRQSEAKDLPRIASIQNPYNFFNRHFESNLGETAIKEDIGLLAYSPLAMGILSGKYLNGAKPKGSRLALFDRFNRYEHPAVEEGAQAYVDLAAEHGLDPSQMALAFVIAQPFVTSNIIGATKMDQLQIDIGSADVTLSEEVLKGIDAIHQRHANPAN